MPSMRKHLGSRAATSHVPVGAGALSPPYSGDTQAGPWSPQPLAQQWSGPQPQLSPSLLQGRNSSPPSMLSHQQLEQYQQQQLQQYQVIQHNQMQQPQQYQQPHQTQQPHYQQQHQQHQQQQDQQDQHLQQEQQQQQQQQQQQYQQYQQQQWQQHWSSAASKPPSRMPPDLLLPSITDAKSRAAASSRGGGDMGGGDGSLGGSGTGSGSGMGSGMGSGGSGSGMGGSGSGGGLSSSGSGRSLGATAAAAVARAPPPPSAGPALAPPPSPQPPHASPAPAPASPAPAPMLAPPPAAFADSGGALSLSLRVHAVTFNMAHTTPRRLPRELFGAPGPGAASGALHADVHVLAFQEACPLGDLDDLLSAHLPATQFIKVSSRRLMDIALFVYVRTDLSNLTQLLDGATVAAGIGNVVGNKGGVAISISLAGARLLLVGCHLAAHDNFLERRNADYARIAAGMPTPPRATPEAQRSAHLYSSQGGPLPPPSRRQPLSTVSAPLPVTAESGGAGGGSGYATHGGPPDAGGLGAYPRRVWASTRAAATGAAARAAPTSPPPPAALHNYHPAAAQPTTTGGAAGGAAPLPNRRVSSSSGALSSLPPGPPLRGSDSGGGAGAASWQQQQLATGSSYNNGGSSYNNGGSSYNNGGSSYSYGGVGGADLQHSQSSPLLPMGADGPLTDSPALEAHDVVIWAGDLNYRIQGTHAVVTTALAAGMYDVLRSNEQLLCERAAGRAFRGFHELPLDFPPTFKHVMGSASDEYNPKRTPSWTDRVLFMCNVHAGYCALRPLYYTSLRKFKDSDHKPVVAGFELMLTPSKRHSAGASCGGEPV
ncbi:hypothetical protein FOA52_003445 [Chlamydomonas sp. UWO 241]|nr:hypothetical protein FOA52_003445 [Chlamydomonas sp. UWO 241]